jgi:4-amino-4-deoxy-L-arabinose transferase-like glycosyltransferase
MSWKNVVFFAALMLLAAIVFGLNVSARSLWEPDEARYSQIATTLVKTGNWL